MSNFRKYNSINPRHAIFEVSKFSYPGRNGLFLYLIGLQRQSLEKVCLLGSGPIEPFEIAALPCFKDSSITAVDRDRDVFDIVCRALDTGQLDVRHLAQVCRSSDSENRYLSDSSLMHRQLCKITHQGWHPYFDNEQNIDTLYNVNQDCASRAKMVRCALQQDLPNEIGQADLIFEGFMLINWEKTLTTTSPTQSFLKRLSDKMPARAWFASTTSVTHYLAEFPGSKPFFRQVMSARLLPTAGVLIRWSVGDDGHITSQFGSVFRKSAKMEKSLTNLGETFENETLNCITNFGVK